MKKTILVCMLFFVLLSNKSVFADPQSDYQDNALNCLNVFPNYFAPVMGTLFLGEGGGEFNNEYIGSTEWSNRYENALLALDETCDYVINATNVSQRNEKLEGLLADYKIAINDFIEGVNSNNFDLVGKGLTDSTKHATSAISIINTMGFTSSGNINIVDDDLDDNEMDSEPLDLLHQEGSNSNLLDVDWKALSICLLDMSEILYDFSDNIDDFLSISKREALSYQIAQVYLGNCSKAAYSAYQSERSDLLTDMNNLMSGIGMFQVSLLNGDAQIAADSLDIVFDAVQDLNQYSKLIEEKLF